MRRNSLLVVTVLTLLTTGFVLPYSGWAKSRVGKPGRRHSRAAAISGQVSPLTTEEGWRWQSCQPDHWRSFLLQR